ncbi:hypothetical protein [Streptomyces sp. NPDC101150]|uniref:hypothetical protein n=1 Tax=Streptomyces sp. NPDC101150 TaxID=3366114 RepID=UPI0038154A88
MIQIQAVDVDKVTRFWRLVHHQGPLSIVQGDTPAVKLVITPLYGEVADEVQSLIAKGAEFVAELECGVLMKDPEGNEFIVEPNPDLQGSLE